METIVRLWHAWWMAAALEAGRTRPHLLDAFCASVWLSDVGLVGLLGWVCWRGVGRTLGVTPDAKQPPGCPDGYRVEDGVWFKRQLDPHPPHHLQAWVVCEKPVFLLGPTIVRARPQLERPARTSGNASVSGAARGARVP